MTINALGGIVIAAVIGLFVQMYLQNRKTKRDVEEAMQKFVKDVETRLAVLDTKVSPLWARVQTQIAAELHHPHARYKEMDKLLEALEALTIDEAGRARLKVLLEQRAVDTHPDVDEEQRKSAKLMILVMSKVVKETEHPGPLVEVGPVGVKGEAATEVVDGGSKDVL